MSKNKNKFKDFTKFIEERRKDAPKFILFGEEYILPPSLSYDAMLRFQALQERQQTDELSTEDVFQIFKAVVGEDNESRLRKHGEFDIDLMSEVIQFCLQAYGITDSVEEVEEDTPGPKQ